MICLKTTQTASLIRNPENPSILCNLQDLNLQNEYSETIFMKIIKKFTTFLHIVKCN